MAYAMRRSEEKSKPDWVGRYFPVFAIRPTTAFIQGWLNNIAATGRPEMYENVSTTKPPRDAEIVLLSSKIRVPVARRDDDQNVPCPICSEEHGKFIFGYPAWFPLEGVVRFIGHQCGAKYFDAGKFREAEAALREEIEAEARQKFLHANLPLIPSLIEIAEGLLPAAQAAKQIHRHCNEKHKGMWEILRSQTREGGALRVDDEVDARVRVKAADRFFRRTVAHLEGLTALLARYDPEKGLRAVISNLRSLGYHPYATIEQQLRSRTTGEQIFLAKTLRTSRKELEEERLSLLDFVRFFNVPNLERLTRWGSERMTPMRVKAFLREVGDSSELCIDWLSEREYLRVQLPARLFEDLTDIPRFRD